LGCAILTKETLNAKDAKDAKENPTKDHEAEDDLKA